MQLHIEIYSLVYLYFVNFSFGALNLIIFNNYLLLR